jgi:hypothetical protein
VANVFEVGSRGIGEETSGFPKWLHTREITDKDDKSPNRHLKCPEHIGRRSVVSQRSSEESELIGLEIWV